MKILKNYIFDALVVVLFAAISFAYFYPADTEGRILFQHDASAGRGGGQEINEYREKNDGETSRWTGTVFSGMPTYQTAPSYDSQKGLDAAVSAYHLWMPENVWYVFVYLLGFYILLRAFNFKEWMAALGAVVWAFSSYFFIIIAAGHIWKVWALAYLPPMIAGIVLAFRKKYLFALLVTSLFGAFEIQANHVQMTYYFMFAIVLMVIAFIIEAAKKKEYLHIAKAIGVCVASACIALMLNVSNLYHTWEYQKETMRGGSELVGSDKNSESATTRKGLDRDYITQWSYGISETWTLLVPNAKGGASVPLAMNETAMKKADPTFYEIYNQIGQYWGEQPGTSGPVYVGAFVFLLFVLGLIIVKGPIKWSLLAATIFSILLSWGKNFMPLTDFFIDYFPMYSKFRTVASILVVAEFTIPLLAMLALKKIVEEPECLGKKYRWLWVSSGITAGIAALFAVAPGILGTVISSSEMASLQQIPDQYRGLLIANLTEMREAMFSADAWRSVAIILIGVALVFACLKKWLKAEYMTAALIVLCLVDMWTVNKRYLNDDMFVEKTERESAQQMTAEDQEILKDTTDCRNYRVLNFASNTFNENETSYYHKSIGGYHAAKLQRYQEMINHYIEPEMRKTLSALSQKDIQEVNADSVMPVLDMLNMRYMILGLQDGSRTVMKNPHAMGNAWFVNKVEFADNANGEIDAIAKINLHTTAIADKKFADDLKCAPADSINGSVKITSYAPNHLTYSVENDKDAVLVFSEVYYPGWTATIDGNEVPVSRVNYILRAIVMPKGKHNVELMFYPKSVDTTETIAYVGYGILLLILLLVIANCVKNKRAADKKE